MAEVDLDSIRIAVSNILVCMKYNAKAATDYNLKNALNALNAIIERNS